MTALERIGNFEDQFTERKEEGVSYELVCKTLVAFANTLDHGQTGILFIGVADRGEIKGVQNPQKKSDWVIKLAQTTCYPSIPIKIEVLNVEAKQVLAVIVSASDNRPHFAGPPFIRVGSQSQAATEAQYTALLATRISPIRELVRAQESREIILVARRYPNTTSTYRNYCFVTRINPAWVEFQPTPSGELFSIPTNSLIIRWEGSMKKLLVSEA